jgi:hypothetical protein
MAGLGEAEWRAHAEQVGRVTLAWNRNSHQLLQIFSHLTGLGSPLAEAIFLSRLSDSRQRAMLKSVAVAVGLEEAYQESLKIILKRLEDVSTGRNLAAHTIFGLSLFDPDTLSWGVKIVPAVKDQDKRLSPDFDKQFAAVEVELAAIYQALEEWLLHTPFPPRPWDGPMFLDPIPGRPEVPPGPDPGEEAPADAFA